MFSHNLSWHMSSHNLTCSHTTCPDNVLTQLVITPLDLSSHNLSRRGTYGIMALELAISCDIYLHFAWQAWHLVTSTATLCGRRGTWRHRSSFCVAGVVLGDIHLHFAWQAWHLWHWAGFGGALGFRCDAGRRGSFGVAGVALGDIYLHFAWQAWYLVTSTATLCGRRGTYGIGLAFVARLVLGVTLGAATLLAWQAWHLATSIVILPAGVVLGDIDCHFAWQAWHLWHWAGFGGALGFRCDAGRRGSFGVACVALGDIYRHFAWQAWYLVTSTFTLRGRHGTYGTGPALVARLVLGVTLGAVTLLAWQAWRLATSIVTLRGRRGTWWHPPSLCEAGVALMALGRLWWRAWL